MSRLTRDRLRVWRRYFETSMALMDVLDADIELETGLRAQEYDVLIRLEDAPDGLRMNELADKILYSKSGLTRVIDRMEKAGLVRRYRPEHDRRSIFVLLTPEGVDAKDRARPLHHEWISRNFSDLLDDADIEALGHVLHKLAANARTRRPGRITA